MKDEGQSKGNIIMVTDGPSIPNPREWRLINAWSIALCGAIITLVLLCTTGPQVYRDAIIFLLTGLGRISRNRFFNLLASTYVEVIRGIPLLVQIFYIYFAISMLVKMEGVTSAVIALSFCYGAYMGEVFRAGILAIPHGQTEAARSLGFNRVQTMFYVVLPQAWRTIIPPVGNECIAMLKDTALVSVIGMPDLMQRARSFASKSYCYFESYTVVALVYLIITLILSKIVSIIEARLNHYDRKK